MDRKYGSKWVVAAALTLLVWPAGASGQTPASERAASDATVDGAGSAVVQRALESRTKGAPEAEVVVFEIADFQCPFCARFAEEVAPTLDERYIATGKVQWVFVNMPLHTHPRAWIAAEAALCAGAAGDAFWPMHHRLFQEQRAWSGAEDPATVFERYVEELDIPLPEYRTCVAEDQVASLILQDVGSAVSAGVNGTPTFIIMKDQQVLQRMVGVQSPEEWATVLDGALR
ncbi:MAG TPA: thioredoxin domain-containing protein [Longimicrobiales bacterium]|nr:thioredoxin domain-containing protein [Longimicrobiales bacterium]